MKYKIFFIFFTVNIQLYSQETTLMREINSIQYPSPFGIYVNPSLQSENTGINFLVGAFVNKITLIPYIITNMKLASFGKRELKYSIYTGSSFIRVESDLEGSEDPFNQKILTFTLANEIEVSSRWFRKISLGLNSSQIRTSHFGIYEDNYFTNDIGVNVRVIELERFLLQSGLSLQNYYSTKVKTFGVLGDREIRKYQPYLDYQFGMEIFKYLFISGTYNIAGEPKNDVQNQSVIRGLGIFQNIQFGFMFMNIMGLNLKFKQDDAIWAGTYYNLGVSHWNQKIKDLQLVLDLRTPYFGGSRENQGIAVVFTINGGINWN